MLSMAAGMTDALCLLRLGGVFASVITGNLVLLAASAVRGLAGPAVHAVTSVGAYAVGVFAGSRLTARRRPDAAATICLTLEAVMLVAFVAVWLVTYPRLADSPAAALLVAAGAAMGLQSVAVRALGRSGLSTTYMTGALTRLVSSFGEPNWTRRLDWVQILALGGLVVGAAAETVVTYYLPPIGPLPAAVLALAAVLIVYRQYRSAHKQRS